MKIEFKEFRDSTSQEIQQLKSTIKNALEKIAWEVVDLRGRDDY